MSRWRAWLDGWDGEVVGHVQRPRAHTSPVVQASASALGDRHRGEPDRVKRPGIP
jgi:hypothetical protein